MAERGKHRGKMADEAYRLLVGDPEGLDHAGIARKVLRMKKIAPEMAERLVCELLGGDPRFEQGDDGRWRVREGAAGEAWLSETEFVVVDVEATGGTAKYNRLIEIGAFRVCGGRVADSFSTLVDPQRDIPIGDSHLTGIYDETVAGEPAAAEVLPDFLGFLGDAPFVGHNAAFDFRTINSEFFRAGMPRMKNPVLCTLKLSRRVWRGLPSYNLDSLVAHFSIGLSDERHRGRGDAWATAVIFTKIIDALAAEGVETLDALLAFQRAPAGKKVDSRK